MGGVEMSDTLYKKSLNSNLVEMNIRKKTIFNLT